MPAASAGHWLQQCPRVAGGHHGGLHSVHLLQCLQRTLEVKDLQHVLPQKSRTKSQVPCAENQGQTRLQRLHLEKLAIRESLREKKVLEISPMAKFVQAFRKFFGLKTTTCHGCNVKPSPNEYEEKLA